MWPGSVEKQPLTPYCCRNALGLSQKRKKRKRLKQIMADSKASLGVFVCFGFVSVANSVLAWRAWRRVYGVYRVFPKNNHSMQ